LLGRSKACAFGEIHHGNRDIPKLLTRHLRIFQILTLKIRAARKLGPGSAFHEREIQRPPGDAKKRNPDQLALEKKTKKREPAIEATLQYSNINPGLVVAIDQVAALAVKTLWNLDIPLCSNVKGKQGVIE